MVLKLSLHSDEAVSGGFHLAGDRKARVNDGTVMELDGQKGTILNF